jgi:hypothetical protein
MTSIITPAGLLAFPTFFSPKPRFQGSEAVFSGILVFSAEAQKSAEYKALKDACVQTAKDEFGSSYNPNVLKWPFRKGEEKPNYQGFEPGTIFISAWTKNKPGIIDGSFNEINDPSAVWAGQMAKFSLTPFAYNTSGNKGVSLGLRNVQITRLDMPRVDGRASAQTDFGGSPSESGSDDDVPFHKGFMA